MTPIWILDPFWYPVLYGHTYFWHIVLHGPTYIGCTLFSDIPLLLSKIEWLNLSKRGGTDGVFEEQPCQPEEHPVLSDYFTQIYILFQIGLFNFPRKTTVFWSRFFLSFKAYFGLFWCKMDNSETFFSSSSSTFCEKYFCIFCQSFELTNLYRFAKFSYLISEGWHYGRTIHRP